MSKITVKKAIASFTPEQLRGLILDIYSKSKEAKEILDFFAEPDIEKVTQDYSARLAKEIYRIHRHMPAPRVTQIKGILKKFSFLEPGYEAEVEVRLDTLRKLIFLGRQNLKVFTESQFNSIVKFTEETCLFLDRNGVLEDHIDDIKKWISETHSSVFWLNGFHNRLTEVVDQWT